jgi:hypothetical protein
VLNVGVQPLDPRRANLHNVPSRVACQLTTIGALDELCRQLWSAEIGEGVANIATAAKIDWQIKKINSPIKTHVPNFLKQRKGVVHFCDPPDCDGGLSHGDDLR